MHVYIIFNFYVLCGFSKQLLKRDADLFGSNRLPIPPSCLITVWAKLSCDPEERLRHPVTLTGIDCIAKKIYISRFLEATHTNTIGTINISVITSALEIYCLLI